MWKKLIVIILSFLGTVSVGYAFYQYHMAAAGNAYQSGGKITGRINKAPSGISGANIGIRKGDKFLLSMKDATGEPIA